jgi:hypothetical protein
MRPLVRDWVAAWRGSKGMPQRRARPHTAAAIRSSFESQRCVAARHRPPEARTITRCLARLIA